MKITDRQLKPVTVNDTVISTIERIDPAAIPDVATDVIHPVRRVALTVIYNGVDISEDVSQWIESASYTDSIDQADTIDINLYDDGRWRGDWAPDIGATLDVTMHLIVDQQQMDLRCGIFAIDELDYSCPPSVVSIKGTSAKITTALRREKKNRAWENVYLRSIAQTIAAKNGLELIFDGGSNPGYKRIDQSNQSDTEFLMELCEREGLRMKISENKLIVYSQDDYDRHDAIDTFYWGDGRLINWSFTANPTPSYKAAVVKYRNPVDNKVYQHTEVDESADGNGQTLRINTRVENDAEAARVAKNKLKAANRRIKSASITLVGTPQIAAGQNIAITGIGAAIDGKYAIEECTHSIWPYATTATLRQI